MPLVRAVIALCALVALAAPKAHADDPFYKGKRLTILINFAPGGPTDIEGRLFAKHLSKHIVGGLSVDTPKDLRLRLGMDMLGIPFKYVTGYRSSPAARLAFQRGEINFFSESPPSYRGVVDPTLVKTGQAIPVFYDAGFDGKSFRSE